MEDKILSVKDFINAESSIGIGYKDYWKESNIDKNVFLPHEQLMTIERRIIWAAYKIGMNNMSNEHKTPSLSGEVLKYHISGEDSIQESIKGLAADYKRQPACRILKGVGNMGTHAGDPGAAARYTHVKGTPLLRAIIKDINYLPLVEDETGLKQPEYLSTPIPMTLINGMSNIGTGHSAYYDERDAREVIDWVENLSNGKEAKLPHPISSTGCTVYQNPKNGYTYYEAVVHREKNFDIITNLPPKTSSNIVMAKLKAKLPQKVAKKVEDASEEGRPVWIKVPKGHLDAADYNKYSMRRARKETPYVWDVDLDTMKMSTHEEIAMKWYGDRISVIGKRISSEIAEMNKDIKRIDLITRYYEEKMHGMSEAEIIDILGKEDADIVLSQTTRVFLKENIDKAAVRKERMLEDIKDLDSKNIHDMLFAEARDIIVKQENYFKQFAS